MTIQSVAVWGYDFVVGFLIVAPYMAIERVRPRVTGWRS